MDRLIFFKCSRPRKITALAAVGVPQTEKDSAMYNPDISVKTYIVISLLFAALFTASVVAIGSPVFNWIFGMVAIATALMAISQSWLDHRASRA